MIKIEHKQFDRCLVQFVDIASSCSKLPLKRCWKVLWAQQISTFRFEWTKSCYVHFDIKLGLKCTDCYCYVILVYGNYLYKKHVEFFSNTWGSSLLSNFFLVCFFVVVVIVNFFSMLFRAFYVCRHATVLVTVFVTKMWRDDPNITWKGG